MDLALSRMLRHGQRGFHHMEQADQPRIDGRIGRQINNTHGAGRQIHQLADEWS